MSPLKTVSAPRRVALSTVSFKPFTLLSDGAMSEGTPTMQYTVKELAADRFMLIADTGEPVLATMNNRDLAQRMAIKLTTESVNQGIADEPRPRGRDRYQASAH
jgi:hypothetical protein